MAASQYHVGENPGGDDSFVGYDEPGFGMDADGLYSDVAHGDDGEGGDVGCTLRVAQQGSRMGICCIPHFLMHLAFIFFFLDLDVTA